MLNESYCFIVKLKEGFIGHHFNLALIAHLLEVLRAHRDKLRVQIISEGLQKLLNFMLIDFICLYFLLNGRGSECQYFRPLSLTWDVARIEEISHYEVIEMLLVCVMGFIKYEHVDVFYLNVAMHQQVIELSRNKNKHIIVFKLLQPVLILVHPFVIFPTYND